MGVDFAHAGGGRNLPNRSLEGVCLSPEVTEIQSSTFDEQTREGVVVVKFGATWCMPCRMLEPVIEQLAASYEGRVRVFDVDTDREPGLAHRFEITTVPAVLVFSGGELVRRFVGLIPFERLACAIEEIAPEAQDRPEAGNA